MSLFGADAGASIYLKARKKAGWRAVQDAKTAAAILPPWQPEQRWTVRCALQPTVAGAIKSYADQLAPCRLWLATFAAAPATIEYLAGINGLTPQFLLFSRILLSRGSSVLEASRRWAGDDRVAVAKIHAKIALLVAGDFDRCMAITGSANLSKNTGYELMELDTWPDNARWLVSQIEAMATEAEPSAGRAKRKRATRR